MHGTLRNGLFASTLIASLALAGAVTASETDPNGGTPGGWLTSYAGARTLGLGGAFVAEADNALGTLWNPAGLQRMNQNELMFENVQLFEDTGVNSFAVAVPGNWLPSIGISMVSLHSGDFQRTNELNDNLGTFKETETAYAITLAKALSPKIAIGANLKLIQQSVEDFSSGGAGFDLGALAEVAPSLRVGLAASNVGGPSVKLRDTQETFPTELRGGFVYEMFNGRGLVTAEVDHASALGTRLHAGGEYWLQPVVALRVGLDDRRATGGFSYRFSSQYQLDYGVADHPLGLSHRVGLSYRFAGFFASSKAEPQVFSPTGEKATTRISLNAHTKAEADTWALTVVNKAGEVVRRFGGPGLPPPHVQWDGKDEGGLPLADGIYAYHLEVKDRVGRVLNGPTRKVEISTGGPQGAVPVVTNPTNP